MTPVWIAFACGLVIGIFLTILVEGMIMLWKEWRVMKGR